MSHIKKNDKKTINAWCSYDIANSVYRLLITAVLFPIYYQFVCEKAFADGIIKLGNFSIKDTVIYEFSLLIGYVVVVVLLPLLSGIADYGGKRRRYMQVFTLLGASACIGLFWFEGSNILYGSALIAIAAISFEGSVLFYDSFLSDIATPDRQDKVSAKGYAWGYVGSVFVLLINIFMIYNYDTLGFKSEMQVIRFSFIEVGIWWALLAQISIHFIKEEKKEKQNDRIRKGIKELKKVARIVMKDKVKKRFLSAFLFYSMGIQTIMLIAAMFGKVEIGISNDKLTVTILILQLVAVVGAIFFGWVSTKTGNKTSMLIMLFIWLLVCFSAYFVYSEIAFYFLAAGIGLVMGGIQSQSRSTYSKLIPSDSERKASFFSFYNITEKIAIVLGMFTFGFIDHITGSMRNSTMILASFFIVAIIILYITPLYVTKNQKK